MDEKKINKIYSELKSHVDFMKLIQTYIIDSKLDDIDSMINIYKLLYNLDETYKKTYNLISSIKKNSTLLLLDKLKEFRRKVDILSDNSADIHEIESLENSHCNYENVAPGIDLNVIHVPSKDYIPKTPLYYLRDKKQFAVNISGKIISGNVGTIHTSSTKKIFMCKVAKKHKKHPVCTKFH